MLKTRAISISISNDDVNYLTEKGYKPSAVMRSAIAHLRAGELEVSDGFFIDPIEEITRVRVAMKEQLRTIKDLEKENADQRETIEALNKAL